jgi:transposase
MRKKSFSHDKSNRASNFYNFDHDSFQQRIELFKALFQCQKNRQIRPILNKFGVHPNRYYDLKQRYMSYGVWGLIDLIQMTRKGEKISPELELQIIEQRLMDVKLSTNKAIKKFDLKCSKANVQKVYAKWGLSRFEE